MDEQKYLDRIIVNPKIFGGKPIIRGHRLAVEHVLGRLAVGDTPEIILRSCFKIIVSPETEVKN